jgi:hypothetical protein
MQISIGWKKDRRTRSSAGDPRHDCRDPPDKRPAREVGHCDRAELALCPRPLGPVSGQRSRKLEARRRPVGEELSPFTEQPIRHWKRDAQAPRFLFAGLVGVARRGVGGIRHRVEVRVHEIGQPNRRWATRRFASAFQRPASRGAPERPKMWPPFCRLKSFSGCRWLGIRAPASTDLPTYLQLRAVSSLAMPASATRFLLVQSSLAAYPVLKHLSAS